MMPQDLPIVIIVIGVILVVLALIVWRRRKEGRLEILNLKKRRAFFTQWIIGIVLALIAAFFMFDGDILGENTVSIARIIAIVGLCLIATSNITLLPLKRK